MFDDEALRAVDGYWRARDDLEAAKREAKAAWIAREDETDAWGRSLAALADSVRALAETTPTTPRAAVELLTVALTELSPPFGATVDPQGIVSTRCGDVDRLEIIRRVRDALEAWR
jgi:hypothetical protein